MSKLDREKQGEAQLFWRFLKQFALPYRGAIFLLVLNIFIRVGLSLWPPYASKEIVDKVLVSNTPNIRLALLLLASMLLVILANQGLVFLFQKLSLRLAAFVSQRIRSRIADHLLKLSRQFYDASHLGKLIMTALGDPGNIAQQITQGVVQAMANFLVLVGGYFILIYMDKTLTLAMTAVFPLMIFSFVLMRPRMAEASEKTRESWGIFSAMVAEKIAAVRVVRSFATEEREAERFGQRVWIHADLNVNAQRTNAWYGFFNGLCIHLGYLVIFVVGGWLYIKGRTTLGTLVAFYGYFNTLCPMVQTLCNLPQTIYSARGSLSKVFQLLDEPKRIHNWPHAVEFKEALREIRFEKLSFRYGPHLPWVLRNLSLRLRAGEKLGILGPSGAGKSTLMALLLRFYEPSEGAIWLNDRRLEDWDLQSLRRAFGLVPQDALLFSSTVRENILYTAKDPGEEAIWAALREAEAEDFVRGLPRGLETPLGEKGTTLSGGQKQRLSIARALLLRPQVLILDNYSSALDGETERRLQATLERVLKHRSAIIISHRVSTVAQCNEIVVMDAGRIVERGNGPSLMEAQGYFRGIYQQQSMAV